LIKHHHPGLNKTGRKSGKKLSDWVKMGVEVREGSSQTKMIPVPPAQEAAEFLCSADLQEEFSGLQMSTCSTLVRFCRQWLQQQ